jgi:hypothetical protein
MAEREQLRTLFACKGTTKNGGIRMNSEEFE